VSQSIPPRAELESWANKPPTKEWAGKRKWARKMLKRGVKSSKTVKADLRGKCLHDGRKSQRDIPYQEYLHTEHWQIVRKLVLERADYQCATCKNAHNLRVHHLVYTNLWHEYENDVTVLCETCHNLIHGQYIHVA